MSARHALECFLGGAFDMFGVMPGYCNLADERGAKPFLGLEGCKLLPRCRTFLAAEVVPDPHGWIGRCCEDGFDNFCS